VQPGFVDAFAHARDKYNYDNVNLLPFGEMLAEGVRLAGSSDDPCVFSGPINTAICGATRRSRNGILLDLDQAVPLEEWIRAYTINAAYAGGQENERGSITNGKQADLVVLSGALDQENPPHVIETWLAGEKVWSKSNTEN
jgi:predicted amidohydrolase YtcJ